MPAQGQFPGVDGVDTQLLGTEVVRLPLPAEISHTYFVGAKVTCDGHFASPRTPICISTIHEAWPGLPYCAAGRLSQCVYETSSWHPLARKLTTKEAKM